MIPLDDYLTARKLFQERSGWGGTPCLLGVLIGLILFSTVESLFKPSPHDRAPLGAIILGLCLLAAANLIGRYWSIRLAPRKKQFPALICPQCEKLIQDPSGVVVATGKCPTCLKHVVKVDPKAKNAGTSLLHLAKLQSAKRWQWRAGVTFVVSIGSAVLVLAFLGITSSFLYASGVISGETQELLLRLGRWGFGIVSLNAVFAAALYSYCQVCCPSCRKHLLRVSTVIASGNCPGCGTAILQGAVPHTEYRPLPKMATVEKAMSRFNVRWLIYLALGLAVSSALMLGTIEIDKVWLQQRMEPSINLVRLALFLIGIVSSIIAVFVPFAFRRFNRYPELVCLSCRRAIYEDSTIVRCTGNCPHCGQRVIKDA